MNIIFMFISISISDIIIIIQLIDELYNRRFSFLSMFERSKNVIIIVIFVWKRLIKKINICDCQIIRSCLKAMIKSFFFENKKSLIYQNKFVWNWKFQYRLICTIIKFFVNEIISYLLIRAIATCNTLKSSNVCLKTKNNQFIKIVDWQ